MLDNQRHLFEIPDDVAYFNCAYLSPQLRAVTAAGLAGMEKKIRPWETHPADFFEPAERVRELFGRVIGADADGVALLPSASYGISTAAANLPIGPDRTVVVVEEQYPSNYYPWEQAVRREGGSIVVAARPADGDWTAAVVDRIDARTAVVAVPNCHWTDGSALDLVAVAEACRDAGSALVIDGSQSVGAAPLDIDVVQPDFLVTVAYKWLLGPYGAAYLWAAPHRREGVPIEHGWMTRENAEDFASLVTYRDRYRAGARRYDVGQFGNFVMVPMLMAALEQIVAWGVGDIAESIGAHTARIADAAASMGFDVPPNSRRLAHMVGIRIPGGAPRDLADRLVAERIYVSIRGDSVRVSPHVYTTDVDVDRFLDVLEHAAAR